MKKILLLSAVLIGAATASQAGVHFSFGLPFPPLPRVSIAAPPVYVESAPVYSCPPAVTYAPPVVVAPPVCVEPPVVSFGFGYPHYYGHYYGGHHYYGRGYSGRGYYGHGYHGYRR